MHIYSRDKVSRILRCLFMQLFKNITPNKLNPFYFFCFHIWAWLWGWRAWIVQCAAVHICDKWLWIQLVYLVDAFLVEISFKGEVRFGVLLSLNSTVEVTFTITSEIKKSSLSEEVICFENVMKEEMASCGAGIPFSFLECKLWQHR